MRLEDSRPTSSNRRRSGLHATAVAALLLVACENSGTRVAKFAVTDLPAPAMFVELALALKRPYVVELPERPTHDRHDLLLEGVTDRDVLDAIQELDVRYHVEQRPGVILYWPGSELETTSPYQTRLEAFAHDGGAETVVRELVLAAGLEVGVQAQLAGSRRPVEVNFRDATVRDVLCEVARQANLGMKNDRRWIRMHPMPD